MYINNSREARCKYRTVQVYTPVHLSISQRAASVAAARPSTHGGDHGPPVSASCESHSSATFQVALPE